MQLLCGDSDALRVLFQLDEFILNLNYKTASIRSSVENIAIEDFIRRKGGN